MRRLYHYTSSEPTHWGSILRDGAIIPLAEKRRRVLGRGSQGEVLVPTPEFPPMMGAWDEIIDGVVWLTRSWAPRQGWMGSMPKGEVRIHVETPDAVPWRAYMHGRGFPSFYAKALALAGGDPSEWYVVEGRVPSDRWARVQLTSTGETIWLPEAA